MDSRLRRVERLTRQSDIDSVYKTGRRFHAKFFRIHVKANTLTFSRFTVSVPRKVCTAVLRNRWKRMLRESFRLNKEQIGPGLDIVAVPTRAPEELQRPQVEFVLIELVKKHRSKP
jgi:ribonuclease P protein component